MQAIHKFNIKHCHPVTRHPLRFGLNTQFITSQPLTIFIKSLKSGHQEKLFYKRNKRKGQNSAPKSSKNQATSNMKTTEKLAFIKYFSNFIIRKTITYHTLSSGKRFHE